jgi:archaellum component FlaG (FlaF/FlaG flagellin family)
MKKVIALVLICLLTLAGCDRRSMNYIIQHEPSIQGIVTDTTDTAILLENADGEYWVSLDVQNVDSMTHFSVGDEVVVYFDGNIAETDPMQITTVYAITLRTPADRTGESRP